MLLAIAKAEIRFWDSILNLIICHVMYASGHNSTDHMRDLVLPGSNKQSNEMAQDRLLPAYRSEERPAWTATYVRELSPLHEPPLLVLGTR